MPETVAANTPKAKRYIAARVKGKGKRQAALIAGAPNPIAADKWAERASKNVEIQKAIDDALKSQGATPEYAVGVLKEVAEQQTEIGARRLAAKDILELHGWRKGDVPTVSLNVKNAFFRARREEAKLSVIEGEVSAEGS